MTIMRAADLEVLITSRRTGVRTKDRLEQALDAVESASRRIESAVIEVYELMDDLIGAWDHTDGLSPELSSAIVAIRDYRLAFKRPQEEVQG